MDYDSGNHIKNSVDLEMASALDMMDIDPQFCAAKILDEVLPEAMLMEILSRLPDARDLARCALVNKFFRSSFWQVKCVRFTCRLKNIPSGEVQTPFKDAVTRTLGQMKAVEDLRLEIEDEMQAKRFKDDEVDKLSLWLSEKSFVGKWVPLVSHRLRNLCIIDYGQQAIFRRSPLLQTLSTLCPNLQTLELRNMFLDCQDCATMKKVTSLTLRCVKLTPTGLRDINACMPNLTKLTLVTVVGLKEAEFKSDNLEVLCLGLAAKVSSVKLKVRSLYKLQLKMACPELLQVTAPNLKSLALCMGQNRSLEFEDVKQLRELLMGASEFSTLAKLSAENSLLEKVFLDIPCMAFEESGKWKGVLQNVPLNVPDMEAIRGSCPNLSTMSVGPGLWHSFEKGMTKKDAHGAIVLPKWPNLRRLILHVILIDVDASLSLLSALMRVMPTLVTLEVYLHESSKIGTQEFLERLESHRPLLCPQPDLIFGSWKKGLKFGCFNF